MHTVEQVGVILLAYAYYELVASMHTVEQVGVILLASSTREYAYCMDTNKSTSRSRSMTTLEYYAYYYSTHISTWCVVSILIRAGMHRVCIILCILRVVRALT